MPKTTHSFANAQTWRGAPSSASLIIGDSALRDTSSRGFYFSSGKEGQEEVDTAFVACVSLSAKCLVRGGILMDVPYCMSIKTFCKISTV